MNQNYYADTAFNSHSPRELPEPTQKFGTVQKLIRSNSISSRGVHAQEYLGYYDLGYIEILNDTSKEGLEILATPAHEEFEWKSLKNPRTVVEMLRGIFAFISWGAAATAILILFLRKFELEAFIYGAVMYAIPKSLFLLTQLALKNNWVKDKNNIIINRRTGLVTFTWEKQRVTLPFDEFDVCMPMGTRPTGSHDYYLRFVHKYSDKWFQQPTAKDNAWEIQQDWEFWQQYMDISMPLPDTIDLEPSRHRDPVTAEWDKKHNRPKDYWKNLDMEKAKEMKRKSRKSAESFPWGSTREQAIASGWKPSGVGQGDWQN